MRDRYMNMNLYNRQNCKIFLGYMTDYEFGPPKNPEDKKIDVDKMPDHQLFAMCNRIRSDITRYINDILKLQQENQPLRKYTKKELEEISYNELARIRKELKPKKEKVVKQEPAKQITIDEAITTIKEDDSDYFDREIMIITPEEAYRMFGEDYENYSENALLELGYRIEDGPLPKEMIDSYRTKNELKEAIINFILKITDEYTKEELYKKELEQLRFLYERVTEYIQEAPTYQEIAQQIRLGH